MENIKYIIESLLFVAEEPLTVDRIKRILTPTEATEIRAAVTELSAEYEAREGGFYLDEVAGGYQIRTRPEYNEWIKKLIQPKPLRLSKPALETLVIIAYKQPIIRSDIEHIRGVDCGGVLRVLLERKLIRILGRKELAGRPLIYATTKRFLEVFDLKSLRDLPTPKEIEELGASASEGGAPNVLDTAATSETLLETSGGIEAAGERLEETESSETGSPADEPARDTLREAENEIEPEPETDNPDKPFEKSS
jgi:segregation and condensation protein B